MNKLWTIGMPAYDNFTEVWFTVQALRLYFAHIDMEIVVVDNYGDSTLAKYIQQTGDGVVRYDCMTQKRGCSPAKNRVFEIAKGENVLIIDSHILLMPGCLDHTPESGQMLQGVLLQSSMKSYLVDWRPEWRAKMWGIWNDPVEPDDLPAEPWESWGTGAGFFAVKRDEWLGFNDKFRGFGGETGYIQEKYRQAGRSVKVHPGMRWMHFFGNQGRVIPYPLNLADRIRNYLLGFQELGKDIEPIRKHFGRAAVEREIEWIEKGCPEPRTGRRQVENIRKGRARGRHR